MWIGQVRQAVAAEWTKFWSVRSTWWGLAGAAVLTVLSALTLGGSRATEMQQGTLPPEQFPASAPVVTATVFAQFALIAVAMLAITSEYASGGIRATLQSVPVRGRLLAAKALVVAPVMFAVAVLFGLGATLTTYAFLSMEVFDGHVTLSPAEVLPDLLRIGGYVALASLLTVGVSLAVRSAAGTLTVVFMLLLGLPMLLAMTGSTVAVQVSARTPTFAGLAFMGSTDPMTQGLPRYPPLEGLGWLLAWTTAALAVGFTVLRRRDA